MAAWATSSSRSPATGTRFARIAAAAGVPILPSAAAAAAATSASASASRGSSRLMAAASRRTPIELITPTRSRPESEPAAVRSAASASGPGIASSGIRAHDASRSFASSFASSPTAPAEPLIASFLQASALSASPASERSTAMSSASAGNASAAPARWASRAEQAKATTRAIDNFVGIATFPFITVLDIKKAPFILATAPAVLPTAAGWPRRRRRTCSWRCRTSPYGQGRSRCSRRGRRCGHCRLHRHCPSACRGS